MGREYEAAVTSEAIAEVGSGAERSPLRTDHDGAAMGIGVADGERFNQILQQADVEVVVRRPVHLDDRCVTGVRHRHIADCDLAHSSPIVRDAVVMVHSGCTKTVFRKFDFTRRGRRPRLPMRSGSNEEEAVCSEVMCAVWV